MSKTGARFSASLLGNINIKVSLLRQIWGTTKFSNISDHRKSTLQEVSHLLLDGVMWMIYAQAPALFCLSFGVSKVINNILVFTTRNLVFFVPFFFGEMRLKAFEVVPRFALFLFGPKKRCAFCATRNCRISSPSM